MRQPWIGLILFFSLFSLASTEKDKTLFSALPKLEGDQSPYFRVFPDKSSCWDPNLIKVETIATIQRALKKMKTMEYKKKAEHLLTKFLEFSPEKNPAADHIEADCVDSAMAEDIVNRVNRQLARYKLRLRATPLFLDITITCGKNYNSCGKVTVVPPFLMSETSENKKLLKVPGDYVFRAVPSSGFQFNKWNYSLDNTNEDRFEKELKVSLKEKNSPGTLELTAEFYAGDKPAEFSEADQKMLNSPVVNPISELKTLVDDWFDPLNEPKIEIMKREGCSLELISEAEKIIQRKLANKATSNARDLRIKKLLQNGLGQKLMDSNDGNDLYLAGRLMEKNHLNGDPKQYFERSEVKGNADATIRLLYLEFRSKTRRDLNVPKLFDRLTPYAKKNHLRAVELIAIFESERESENARFNKKFGPADRTATRKWYCQAAELGSVTGAFMCGETLVQGVGGPVDTAKGVEWLKKAAERNHAMAARDVASFYSSEKNTAEEKKWICESYLKGPGVASIQSAY